MSSLNNNNVTNFLNSGATRATGTINMNINSNANTVSNNASQELLKNAMLASAASNNGCGNGTFASNHGVKDSLLQHMATSFMANNPGAAQHQPQLSFPSDVFERRNSLDPLTAIAQATSIANSTTQAQVATVSNNNNNNNTSSSLNNLNAAANASALTSSMLNGGATAFSTTTTAAEDIFEPVPLNGSSAAGQPDNALARMLSKALDEITSGFDSDPLADYNSLYNMDLPFQQSQSQQSQVQQQQQAQAQQDLLSQNVAFLQATNLANSNSSNNKRSLPAASTTAVVTPSNKRARTSEEDCKSPRFRPYQERQWVEQFDELLKFKEERGNCLVPHTFEENPTLSRWVKRQRYQYKLKQERKQSTMTDARIVQLEQVGFVWDSHAAAWQERLQELASYKQEFGDCNVPSNYPQNPQLATWVKCQRRQCKLFWCGKSSNMTLDRFASLNQLGFTWELRNGSISKKMAAVAAAQGIHHP